MDKRGGWNRGMKSERTLKILELRRSGMSLKKIAAAVGCACTYCSKVCKDAGIGGAIIEQRLTEEQAADYVNRAGFTYVGGYTSMKKPITVKCRDCGRTFERQAHIFRDVVSGTWKGNNWCPFCFNDHLARERRRRESEQEHEAQKKAQLKAERLSRTVNDEITKRLAIHVCKNCGNEFSQMVTGYNSTKYCSEKCQNRYFNRRRCEKRYKTLMAREHNNDISLEKLFKRDHGVCYLCGEQCDWNDGEDRGGVFVAGPHYPSIDHVIPVAKGGTHTWNNIKLACRECNWLKRDAI